MRARDIAVAACAVLLGACETAPTYNGTYPRPGVGAGFVETDENTDPRLTHQTVSGRIGTLSTDGPNVYLNGETVASQLISRRLTSQQPSRRPGPIPVPNNSTLATGPDSGARVDFAGGPPRCSLAIRELERGRLYGESGGCVHNLGSRHAAAIAGGTQVAYHLGVTDSRTQITVLRGGLVAWPERRPDRRVRIPARHQATVTRFGVEGPRELEGWQLAAITEWRRKFNFSPRPLPDTGHRPKPGRPPERGPSGGGFWDAVDGALGEIVEGVLDSRSPGGSQPPPSVPPPAGPSGSGAKEEYCRRYAKSAVSQNSENVRRGCGFSGPRWSSDYGHHYDWCVRGENYQRLAAQGEQHRARELDECREREALVDVPNVEKLKREVAEARLRGAGLRVGNVDITGGGGDALVVMSQTPKGGTRVRKGSSVDLVLQPVVW